MKKKAKAPSHLLHEGEPCSKCGSRLANCECPAEKKALKTIKAKGAPPKKGLCPVRPPLDGSQGNPMLFCLFKAGHKGRHSWETKK